MTHNGKRGRRRLAGLTWIPNPTPPGAEGLPMTSGCAIHFSWSRPLHAPLVFQAMVDDVAEIYVNGVKAAELAWRGDRYQTVNFPEHMGLRLGSNVLAVHCRNDNANGKIDVGLLSQGDEQAAAEILDRVLRGGARQCGLTATARRMDGHSRPLNENLISQSWLIEFESPSAEVWRQTGYSYGDQPSHRWFFKTSTIHP